MNIPAAIDVERTLLGAILLRSEFLEDATKLLDADDFYLDSHKRIFLHMKSLFLRDGKFDLITLSQYMLDVTKDLQSCGGMAYLADLDSTLGVVNSFSIDAGNYCRILKEKARLRRLISLCSATLERAGDQGESSLDLIEKLQAGLAEAPSSQSETSSFLVDYPDFVMSKKPSIDWLLHGIIERGANGFIAAEPKGSKSFCSIDLAIAMATGSQWLGFSVPRPVKVALVSREDNPSLTAWRLNALSRGRQMTTIQAQLLEDNLMINTRQQTASLMLDTARDLESLIQAVKQAGSEFIFLDVLNVLHASDENDNTQMAAILRKVKSIQEKTGAQIGILHHYNKNDSGRITQRLRGASAIAGFAEWIIGISMHDEEAHIRRMDFEIKAGNSPDSVYYCIDSTDTTAKLGRITIQPANMGKSASARKQ